MKPTNNFKQTIQHYLEERAKADGLFAKSFANPKKSVDECCNYILGEARKRGNAVAMSDAEVFGMAVHYYDEENIKVEKMPANQRASVSKSADKSMELTEEDKKAAREAAIKRLTEEQYALLRKKPAKAKREETEVKQMSLF